MDRELDMAFKGDDIADDFDDLISDMGDEKDILDEYDDEDDKTTNNEPLQ